MSNNKTNTSGINKLAVIYITVAAVGFTCMNLLIKEVSHLPAFELVFFRSIGTWILVMLYLKRKKIPYYGSRKPILFVRAIVGLVSLVLFFWALKTVPVGTATSLRYVSPIFAAILAVIILKEKLKPIQWLYFLMAFIGVLVVKGFDTRIDIVGLIAILISALLVGLVFVLIRKIGDSDHHMVIINYFMSAAVLLGGGVTIFNWVKPQGYEWLVLLGVSLAGYFGQVFMTQALQMEESNIIVPFKYTEVIFTLIFGWILFGETQTWYTVGGISLILLALVGNFRAKMA